MRFGKSKSLKDQNRWQLWLTIVVNVLVLYTIVQFDVIVISGFQGLLSATPLLPVGMALVVTSVANGVLDANMKARVVFLRWHHALPGHRAFSKYAALDPRVDLNALKKAIGKRLPATPQDENQVWYRLYKEVESDPAVAHIHREFLFTRDYTSFALLFLIGFGSVALIFVVSLKVSLIYCGLLLAQLLLVRHAAATYGVRLVTTVLARKAAAARPPAR